MVSDYVGRTPGIKEKNSNVVNHWKAFDVNRTELATENRDKIRHSSKLFQVINANGCN